MFKEKVGGNTDCLTFGFRQFFIIPKLTSLMQKEKQKSSFKGSSAAICAVDHGYPQHEGQEGSKNMMGIVTSIGQYDTSDIIIVSTNNNTPELASSWSMLIFLII